MTIRKAKVFGIELIKLTSRIAIILAKHLGVIAIFAIISLPLLLCLVVAAGAIIDLAWWYEIVNIDERSIRSNSSRIDTFWLFYLYFDSTYLRLFIFGLLLPAIALSSLRKELNLRTGIIVYMTISGFLLAADFNKDNYREKRENFHKASAICSYEVTKPSPITSNFCIPIVQAYQKNGLQSCISKFQNDETPQDDKAINFCRFVEENINNPKYKATSKNALRKKMQEHPPYTL
jgi:hypothetical protein